MTVAVSSALRVSPRSICSRCAVRLSIQNQARNAFPQSRQSSTTNSPPATGADAQPPLLRKFKSDLKTAMRAKDTPRLNVLRGLISETNQLASSSTPIKTDMQLVSLLRKRKTAAQAAAKEAEDVKRDDLKHKQEKEIEVINEYVGSVQVMDEEEVRRIVEGVVGGMKKGEGAGGLKNGLVMKELLKPGGELDGKSVDKSGVAKVVGDVLSKA